jgi:hypothetical protein
MEKINKKSCKGKFNDDINNNNNNNNNNTLPNI